MRASFYVVRRIGV